MTVSYATPRDVYDLGLSAQSFVVRPRPLDARAGDSLDPTTGTFALLGHGLSVDDIAWLVLVASGGALPGGSSALTRYYPLPLDGRRFQLATSFGGAAVTFSSTGTISVNGASSWGILVDPERRLERILLDESSDVDQCLTAHATPLVAPFPQKVIGMVARCAARRALAGMMFDNAATKVASERLDATAQADEEQKERWRMGQPINPTPIDATDGIADNGARGVNRLTSGRVSPAPWVTGRI